jgi:hypothetical protein
MTEQKGKLKAVIKETIEQSGIDYNYPVDRHVLEGLLWTFAKNMDRQQATSEYQFEGQIEFESPINRETSFGETNLSKNAKSIITVKIQHNGTGFFEWEIAELDEYVEGGLWFENRELVDYDGVFDLPKQLVDYLQKNGYDMDYCS